MWLDYAESIFQTVSIGCRRQEFCKTDGKFIMVIKKQLNEIVGKSCSIFSGSPRDLIVSTDISKLSDKLKEIPSCYLYFKLFSHRKLLKLQGLVAENEALGR